jgi:hypothetical protein
MFVPLTRVPAGLTLAYKLREYGKVEHASTARMSGDQVEG